MINFQAVSCCALAVRRASIYSHNAAKVVPIDMRHTGIPLAKNISCHHLASNKQVAADDKAKMHHGTFIDFQTRVGKRDAGSQRITVVRAARHQAGAPSGFSPASGFIAYAVIKAGSQNDRVGEAGYVRDGMGKFFPHQPQLAGQLSQRIGLRAGRRHKVAVALLSNDNRISQFVWLLEPPAAQIGVTLRPSLPSSPKRVQRRDSTIPVRNPREYKNTAVTYSGAAASRRCTQCDWTDRQ